jgi:hypothetical protein
LKALTSEIFHFVIDLKIPFGQKKNNVDLMRELFDFINKELPRGRLIEASKTRPLATCPMPQALADGHPLAY